MHICVYYTKGHRTSDESIDVGTWTQEELLQENLDNNFNVQEQTEKLRKDESMTNMINILYGKDTG